MRLLEFDSQTFHPHGTIAMLKLSEACAQTLSEWCRDNRIPCIDKDKLHCTVLYSKKPVEHLVKHNNKKILAQGKILEWKKLGPALTLHLDAPLAHKIHKYMRKQGGTHDFPEFIAHTSVSYDWPQQDLPAVIPEFPLIFDQLHVKAIDPNFAG